MIDGVIKYTIEHLSDEAPEFKKFEELERVRYELFTLGLIGEKQGIGYGNISLKDTQGDSFFITATQTGNKELLGKEFYTYVEDYNFQTFRIFSKGPHKPSSEALSHAVIYSLDKNINGVIHIHSNALWKFMIEKKYLYTEAEYGTKEMITEIQQLYKQNDPLTHNIFVMKGHQDGIICFAPTIEEAKKKLFHLMRDLLYQL